MTKNKRAVQVFSARRHHRPPQQPNGLSITSFDHVEKSHAVCVCVCACLEQYLPGEKGRSENNRTAAADAD